MYHTHDMIYIQDLKHYQNGGGWTGSWGNLRYKTSPQDGEILAEIWRTPLCYELSQVEETRRFPMTEAGILEAEAWLEDLARAL